MSAPGRPQDDVWAGARGTLAPAATLDRWLQIVLVVLVAMCAVRYVDRHGVGTTGVAILIAAAALAATYATRSLLPGRSWWPTAWVVVMVALWAGLTVAAPSFAWCAVPVAFAVLRVMPFGPAAGIVVAMTCVVTVAWLRITEGIDPTLVVGPVGIALVTVISYRALERVSQARQELVDELTDAQADLAEEQRLSGALAERTRLSREIHDSVGQDLSSINLLLQAAEQSWPQRPDTAREHVRTAASTARNGLDEVRRVVRDLAPAALVDDATGTALSEAIRRAAAEAAPWPKVQVHVHGDPVPVRQEVAVALVRTVRGALANVREHARATRVAVTLTYDRDEVHLDVRDDGQGFAEGYVDGDDLRGRGLAGIRDRAESLGGSVDVESAPGEGTTVAVRFPVEEAG